MRSGAHSLPDNAAPGRAAPASHIEVPDAASYDEYELAEIRTWIDRAREQP